MRFHASITSERSPTQAVESLIQQARAGMQGQADLVFFFFTTQYLDDAAELIERLWLELDPECVIGCSAEGVIGVDQEIETGPGMALLVGSLPGVRIHSFHIALNDWASMVGRPGALAERVAFGPNTRAILGFGDPFTTPISEFLARADAVCPGAPLLGGMASSGTSPGRNLLVRNDQVFDEGFVGVSLSGPLAVETIVSQGARPIGRPLIITKAHDNVIEQLGGRPAILVLQELITDLDEPNRQLLHNGLLIGQAISEYRESFGRGDFLIRNLMGLDEPTSAIAIADRVRVGQTIQFHVRDAFSADEDLAQLLQTRAQTSPAPVGGLLFTCNGRGTRLFPAPNHDIAAARQALPDTPLAGFFAAGELGPVSGRNFIHAHTASLALFRPTSSEF